MMGMLWYVSEAEEWETAVGQWQLRVSAELILSLKQDRHFTYKTKLRRVPLTTATMEKQ
jgi:hypothetical protein